MYTDAEIAMEFYYLHFLDMLSIFVKCTVGFPAKQQECVLAISRKSLCGALDGIHRTQPIMTQSKNGVVTRVIAYLATETIIAIVFLTTSEKMSIATNYPEILMKMYFL